MHCQACIHDPSPFLGIASVFDYSGPAAVLVRQFKYQKMDYLSKGLAAALFLQFNGLGWPLPDYLVPVPISFTKGLKRGFNQSSLLSKELGTYLKRPCKNLLKKRIGGVSQARLPLKERELLEKESFYFRDEAQIEGKTILLIDDVVTSGSTLRKCAEILVERNPACIYALTLCKTKISKFNS